MELKSYMNLNIWINCNKEIAMNLRIKKDDKRISEGSNINKGANYLAHKNAWNTFKEAYKAEECIDIPLMYLVYNDLRILTFSDKNLLDILSIDTIGKSIDY